MLPESMSKSAHCLHISDSLITHFKISFEKRKKKKKAEKERERTHIYATNMHNTFIPQTLHIPIVKQEKEREKREKNLVFSVTSKKKNNNNKQETRN